MDFKLQNEEGDTATFIPNGEWALLGIVVVIIIVVVIVVVVVVVLVII